MKKLVINTFIIYCLLSAITLLSLPGCSGDKPNGGSTVKNSTPPPPKPLVLVDAPKINADSAYAFVKKQVEFGPRVPNTDAHVQCGNYFLDKLKSYGWEVKAQGFDAIRYDGVVLKSRNIIASYKAPAAAAAKRTVLLAAHWDTRHVADKDTKDTDKPIDGANDGASGVGVLLEIARTIHTSPKKPTVNIDIVLFDSEDLGYPESAKDEHKKADTWCLGSQYWAKNNPGSYYYGILLDMVGAKGAKMYKEGFSVRTAGETVNEVWAIAAKLGYGNVFIPKNAPEIVDDHTYVNKHTNIPMIDIIEFDPTNETAYFAKYHHTHADNMSIIDKNTLEAVGQTVLQYVYNTAASSDAEKAATSSSSSGLAK
ncbi:M28 family peptidase [Microscilla marina]|nr:M28 family peptidase [Microscilla marina]